MGKIEDTKSKQQCSVPQCKSRSSNEISLFRFPKEESQRKKWADAIKIEKGISAQMQVCSRHFVKNDYIMAVGPGDTKVKRLKKSAVPSQNLPWQFPNKRVSPTLAKARMERLKNRSLQKTSESESPEKKTDGKKPENAKQPEIKKSESESKTSSVKSDIEQNSEDMSEDDEKVLAEKSSAEVEHQKEDEGNNKEAVEKNGSDATEAKTEDIKGRGPTRLRLQKGVLKCEHCGRKCLTPQALQTHQQIAHKNVRISHFNAKKDTPVINKPSPKPSVPIITVRDPTTLQKTSVLKTNVTKTVEKSLNSSEVEKVLQDNSDFAGTASDSDESLKEKPGQRKTEFECPLCKKRFSVYFTANKHIQKYHGPQNGSRTPTLLPKPNRLEICTGCDVALDSSVHLCLGPMKFAMGFVCSGCEQEYKTLILFDMHKSSRHNDGVESMFFPTVIEFEMWKQKMQQQTKVKYSLLEQNDVKKIHRCSHWSKLGTGHYGKQRMCPSSIVVQEFTKGFQVHYYPHHYDHAHVRYNLSKAFKKYSISTLMSQSANKPDSEEEEDLNETDLYLQFKKITDVLVNEAARINVNGLKQLMRKALDMIAIVNNYVEDEDDDIITSPVIKMDPDNDDLQDQVKKALSSLKRTSKMEVEVPVKRRKPVFQSTENLKRKEVKVRAFTPVNMKEETENKFDSLKQNQSPSFIDTFQDFVGKSLGKSAEKKKKQSEVKKTPPVKTKIGQFKPKTPPKKVSASPKSESPNKSVTSVKEVKYEVKEQENDCNILILKI